MPVLFSAPTLIITDLKKAFAVFGLMPIRPAICFVLRSWSRRSTVSLSRRVSLNFPSNTFEIQCPSWISFQQESDRSSSPNSEIRFHRERPKLVAVSFPKRLHSEISKARNRYHGHCWEAGIGSALGNRRNRKTQRGVSRRTRHPLDRGHARGREVRDLLSVWNLSPRRE